eukprot:GHVR01007726.1.p1 GENE.GHVR01007726.1~~GHVR01007726.1.p1  ORF type:complete len:363 (+),score=49.47 GHVR01007726.1:127-1215(+)
MCVWCYRCKTDPLNSMGDGYICSSKHGKMHIIGKSNMKNYGVPNEINCIIGASGVHIGPSSVLPDRVTQHLFFYNKAFKYSISQEDSHKVTTVNIINNNNSFLSLFKFYSIKVLTHNVTVTDKWVMPSYRTKLRFDMSKLKTYVTLGEMKNLLPETCLGVDVNYKKISDEGERVNESVILRAIATGVLPQKGEVATYTQLRKDNNIKHINKHINMDIDGNSDYVTDDDILKFWDHCAPFLFHKTVKIAVPYNTKNGSNTIINLEDKWLDIDYVIAEKIRDSADFESEYQTRSNPWNFSLFVDNKVSIGSNRKVSIGSKILEDHYFNKEGDFLYYYPKKNKFFSRTTTTELFKVIINRNLYLK